MCDPATLGIALAASMGGSYLTGQNALSNAQAQANARNGVLGSTIGGLSSIYNKTNAPAFAGAMAGYSGDAGLGTAQDARTATNLGNIAGPAPTAGEADAPPASRDALASKLSDAFNFATNHAKSQGALGGYTDALFNRGLDAQDASRTINFGNSQANNLKGLLGPEQDLAAQEAYKNPSMAGSFLSGIGSILGSKAGTGKFPSFGTSNPVTGYGQGTQMQPDDL